MRNLISGSTLHEHQLLLGPKEGLESFTKRCTGRTLSHSLLMIATAMSQGSVDLGPMRPSSGSDEVDRMKYQILQRLDQMGLVGFKLEEDVLSYYPFEEYESVKEIVREVEVQVSPFNGEVVSPRSYSFKQDIGGPEIPVGSVEQGDPEVCLPSSESPVEPEVLLLELKPSL